MTVDKYPKWASIAEAASACADSLMGTCMSINDATSRLECEGIEDDPAFCAELDAQVFECQLCGWWSCISELADNSDQSCLDCVDGPDDDDDED